MIVYFTGTGNSRYVAQRFAAALGDDLIAFGERTKRCIVGIIDHIRHIKKPSELRQVTLILVVEDADPLTVSTQIVL